ncbi:MAG: YhcN/YlaJ family sporulation lipoprotein [Firmicutes bacterium]|nr:YhcN/YlaJ family sporulation lipoprotein [Bacillota bacterium]
MKRFGLLLMCLALVLVITACAAATPAPAPIQSPMTSPMPGGTGELNPYPTDGAAQTAAMSGVESSALSKKANDAAVKISEIDSCVTAIIGDTCLAGVTFDPRYQGALTDRIRDMVSSRIQSVAPDIQRVAVTNDPELAAQINTVAEKISKANALGGLTGEFDTVLGRIQ